MNLLYLPLVWITVLIHIGFMIFVLAGGLLTSWQQHLLWAHLACVIYAVSAQLIGFDCFLTDVEKWLRVRAGQPAYPNGFLQHYIFQPLGLTGKENLVALGYFVLVIVINAPGYQQKLFPS